MVVVKVDLTMTMTGDGILSERTTEFVAKCF